MKVKDVDFETMGGVVLGKGKQYGTFTFNEQAREHLQSYLKKRTELQPHEKHDYLFTPSNNGTGK